MRQQRSNILFILFLLPSLIGTTVFVLWPFTGVAIRSFQDAMGETFIGLDNYRLILQNEAMGLASWNTFRFIGICVPLQLLSSLLLSMLMQKISIGKTLLSSTFMIPMAIPAACAALLWQVIFAQRGLLNGVIVSLGAQPTLWLASELTFWVLIVTYLWRNLGFAILLWCAAFSGINQSLSEAAQVDGANAAKRFFHITLPQLLPAAFTITVLSLLNALKVFREAYLIAGNYPHSSIYMLQHLFNNWLNAMDMQKISTAAIWVALTILVLIIALKSLVERKQA